MKPFHVQVPDLHSAALVMDALSKYDLFQFNNRVKPDYCNAQGLEVYSRDDEDGEFGPWIEWNCADGEDIAYHIRSGGDLSCLVWEGVVSAPASVEEQATELPSKKKSAKKKPATAEPSTKRSPGKRQAKALKKAAEQTSKKSKMS